MKKLIILGAVMLVLALLLTQAPACGKGGEEVAPGFTPTPGSTPVVKPTPTPQSKTLKWGIITSLSGPGAAWGTQLAEGFEFAVQKINQAGGLKVGNDRYTITVVKCDNKLMGSEAATCATRMVYDEKTHYVYGMFLGTTIQAALPILNEGKCFLAAVEAQYASPDYPYYWGMLPPMETYVGGWYEQLHDYKPDIKTVAFVTTTAPADAYTYEAARAGIERLFKAEVVHVATYELGATDFYPVLTQIAAKNPDAVSLVGGPSGDQALQIKQLRELGYKGQFLGSNAGDPGIFVEVAGKQAVEGFLINEPDYGSEVWPETTRAIHNEYAKLHPGAPFGLCQYLGYGAAMLYKQAIEKAGSIDPDAVVKVLDDPSWTYEWFGAPGQSLGGLKTYGIRRVHQDEVSFTVVRDGKKVQLSHKKGVVP